MENDIFGIDVSEAPAQKEGEAESFLSFLGQDGQPGSVDIVVKVIK